MDLLTFIPLQWPNLLALVWFLCCFKGYTYLSSRWAKTRPCLVNTLHLYRLNWMSALLDREARIADMSAIANLERSVAFFASSTMLILAGLLTVLGASEKAIGIIAELPFVAPVTKLEWDFKLLVMIILFIYAFFKFTWSLRQYGFCSVLVGGAPGPEECSDTERTEFVQRSARMLSMAANNFNYGLRSYYFSIALLGWFINPWFLMVFSLCVVIVLYRREFKSETLLDLLENIPAQPLAAAIFRK